MWTRSSLSLYKLPFFSYFTYFFNHLYILHIKFLEFFLHRINEPASSSLSLLVVVVVVVYITKLAHLQPHLNVVQFILWCCWLFVFHQLKTLVDRGLRVLILFAGILCDMLVALLGDLWWVFWRLTEWVCERLFVKGFFSLKGIEGNWGGVLIVWLLF